MEMLEGVITVTLVVRTKIPANGKWQEAVLQTMYDFLEQSEEEIENGLGITAVVEPHVDAITKVVK